MFATNVNVFPKTTNLFGMSLDKVNSMYKKKQSQLRLQDFVKGGIRWKGSRNPATRFPRLGKSPANVRQGFQALES